MSDKDNRTATQRIEDLEKVVTTLYMNARNNDAEIEALKGMRGNIGLIREALKILNRRIEAVIQLSPADSGVNEDAVNALVTKMNVEGMTAEVAESVKNGLLVSTDVVADDSYLVCEEYDKEGNLSNPRLQFALSSQSEQAKALLKGKKAGESVTVGAEGDLSSTKIVEVYTLVDLNKKAQDAAQAAALADQAVSTPDATPAAPAAEAPTPVATTEAPAQAAPANELPAETPVDFSIDIHGQSEATLASTTPDSATA